MASPRGVQLALVDRVAGATVWVTVLLEKGGRAGPYRCQFLEGPGAVAAATGAATAANTGAASAGTAHTHPGAAHTHPVTAPLVLAKGDRVCVAFVAGDADRPIVLGRVATA